jgi:hypothetical protein
MTWKRIGMACVVSVALVACQKVEQGVLQPIPPLAGLRYVNLVNDTSGVDFRIINFIGDAPSAGLATFRTGGAAYGVSSAFLPYHWPVEAARDVHIRVFMNDTLPALASQVVFDTTCTFAEGKNYTFFLYGSARGAGVHALVTLDSVPTITGTNIAVRTINLASSLAPTIATGTNVDVDIVAQSATSPLTGTATFANVAYKGVSTYSIMAVSATLKAVVSAPAARTFTTFTANLPAGVVGTATLNPVAGSNVPLSAISAVVVPASVTGTRAPQTAAFLVPTVLFLIDQRPALTAP